MDNNCFPLQIVFSITNLFIRVFKYKFSKFIDSHFSHSAGNISVIQDHIRKTRKKKNKWSIMDGKIGCKSGDNTQLLAVQYESLI